MHRCSDCIPAKFFKDRSNFHRHCRAVHLNIKYQCASCALKFSRKARKDEHEANCTKLELVAPSPCAVDLSVDPDSCEEPPVKYTVATHVRFESDEEEEKEDERMVEEKKDSSMEEKALGSNSSEESDSSSGSSSGDSDSGSSSEEDSGDRDNKSRKESNISPMKMPESPSRKRGREEEKDDDVLEIKYSEISEGVVRCWVERHGGRTLVRERCSLYVKTGQGETVGRVVFNREYVGSITCKCQEEMKECSSVE